MARKELIHCRVWCGDRKLEEMGVETNEWLDMAIRLGHITSIKETSGDFIGERKAAIYAGLDHFTTDMDYDEAVKIWEEWLG